MNNETGLLLKYFVLNPSSKDLDHARASRESIKKYAECIEPINPNLANDLRTWIGKVQHKTANDCGCGYCDN